MKRFLHILSIALLLPIFSACSLEGIENLLKLGKSFASAKTFKFDENIITANADGDYLAKMGAGTDFVFKKGEYELIDAVYNFRGLGTLSINAEGKIVFTPEGSTISKTYANSQVITPSESGLMALLNGTWDGKESIISIKGLDKSFQGFDMNAIAEFAKEQGVELGADLPDNLKMTDIIITDGYIGIEFANGEIFMGEMSGVNGLNFDLNDISNSGLGILTGSASLDIVDNIAVLIIKSVINDNTIQSILTLNPTE